MIKLEQKDIIEQCGCSQEGYHDTVLKDSLREILQDLLDSNFTAWGDGTYRPSTITTYNDIKERFAVLFKDSSNDSKEGLI